LEAAGLRYSGTSPDKGLVEIVELKDHPWFLGCQFHPEFRSKPMDPHPLFREFIKASLKYGAGLRSKEKKSKKSRNVAGKGDKRKESKP
jgi:CTP synthase